MKKREARGASSFVFGGRLDFVKQSLETLIASIFAQQRWRNTRKS
jgi:hypothetical protein